jgi:hypothetical protein
VSHPDTALAHSDHMLSLVALAFTPPAHHSSLLAPHSVSNARAGLSVMAQVPMVSRRTAALNLGAAGVLGAAGAAGAFEPPPTVVARALLGDTVKAAEERAQAAQLKKVAEEKAKEEMQEKLAAMKAARKAAREALPKR